MRGINPRQSAAVQFWVLAEFVAAFLPIPFIDQLLMPVVFMLDRRVWAYTQAINVAQELVRWPRVITGMVATTPYILDEVISRCFQGWTDPWVLQVLRIIQALVSSWQGLVVFLGLITIGSVIGSFIACWFWGGYLNRYMRKIYGWHFTESRRFRLWEACRSRIRPLFLFNRKVLRKFHFPEKLTLFFWLGVLMAVTWAHIGLTRLIYGPYTGPKPEVPQPGCNLRP